MMEYLEKAHAGRTCKPSLVSNPGPSGCWATVPAVPPRCPHLLPDKGFQRYGPMEQMRCDFSSSLSSQVPAVTLTCHHMAGCWNASFPSCPLLQKHLNIQQQVDSSHVVRTTTEWLEENRYETLIAINVIQEFSTWKWSRNKDFWEKSDTVKVSDRPHERVARLLNDSPQLLITLL